MGTLRDVLAWTGIILLVCGVLYGVFICIDTVHSLYTNGIPRTHKGHIIYISHRYNKFYNYDWTDVEVLTYSGDTHHIQFWGHPEFEMDTTYRIYTEIRKRFYLFPLPSWQGNELIIKLEVVGS